MTAIRTVRMITTATQLCRAVKYPNDPASQLAVRILTIVFLFVEAFVETHWSSFQVTRIRNQVA